MSDIILGICIALSSQEGIKFNSCLNDVSYCVEKIQPILFDEVETAKHCLVELKVLKKEINRIRAMDSLRIVK